MKVTLDKARSVLIVEIEVQVNGDSVNTHPSGSGKTQIVASTNGNQATSCIVNGKPLTVGMNAYIK